MCDVAQAQGPHVYQAMPSAMTHDCKAMAIGARSQSARTYLEKNIDAILGAAGALLPLLPPSPRRTDTDTLIHHALQALQDCLPNDTELSLANTEISVVGAGTPFALLSDEEVKRQLAGLDKEQRPAPADEAAGDASADVVRRERCLAQADHRVAAARGRGGGRRRRARWHERRLRRASLLRWGASMAGQKREMGSGRA